MPRVRRVLPLLPALALLAALLAGIPAAQASPSTVPAAAPAGTKAVGDGCLQSSQPDGHILCGYHQDGPWRFGSGRTVTCWAGIQLKTPPYFGWEYRVWHKCHAVGVHGTIVPARATWRNVKRAQYTWDGHRTVLGTACTDTCTKRGLEIYWVGVWNLLNSNLVDIGTGWSTDAHVVVSIENTDDTTSDHCVASNRWYPNTGDGPAYC